MLKHDQSHPEENLPKNKPFDVVDFISKYVLISLLLGTLLFAVLFPLGLSLSRPSYEASGMLRITPVIPSLITKSEEPSIINYFGNFARTQVKRVTEYSVLADALSQLDQEYQDALFAPGLSQDQRVAILGARLQVRHLSRTHLLQISMEDGQPHVVPELINKVMHAYLAKLRREMEEKNRIRLEYLHEKREVLTETIADKETSLKDLAGSIRTASFSEDFNLDHHRAQWLQKAYVSQLSERILLEKVHLENVKESEAWSELSLEPMVSEIVMNDQSIDFTSSWTYQELQKMRASLDGVTEQNTDRIYVERRMEAMRDYEKKLLDETYQQADDILEGKREYEISRSLLKSEADFAAANQATQQLEIALSNAKSKSSETSRELIKADGMRSDLGFQRDLLFRIDTRIHELKAESKAPLRVQIESIALTPKSPKSSNKKKLVVVIGAGSYGVFFGFFVLVAFLDRRIMNMKHFRQALGPVVTKPLPESKGMKPYGAGSDAGYQSAVRSLASRLWNENRQFGSKKILFTGVDARAGVTCLTHQAVKALGEMGLKVLLVNTVAASHQPELTGSGTALPSLNGSDYLGCESDVSSTLNQVEKLVSEYDLICLDSGPIRESDQTEFWALHADTAVVIAQNHRTQFGDLKTVMNLLGSLDVKSIAPILNLGGPKTLNVLDRFFDKLPPLLRQLPMPF